MGSVAAQVLWPNFLNALDWRLNSIIGRDCKFSSLCRQADRTGSMVSRAIDWGPRSSIIAIRAPWPDIHMLSSIDRQSLWWDLYLGTAVSRNVVRHNLNTGCCKPYPLFHLYLIPNCQVSQIPSVIPVRPDLSGPFRKHLATLEELNLNLELSFLTGKTISPGVPSQCGTVPAWRTGNAVRCS